MGGLNQEQLTAAATWPCLPTASSNNLAKAGPPPQSVDTVRQRRAARVSTGKPTHRQIELCYVGRGAGIDEAVFAQQAEAARRAVR